MDEPPDRIRARLEAALLESERLRDENAKLKQRLGVSDGISEKRQEAKTPFKSGINQTSPSAAKIALYRSLFRGRDDIYAVRWENAKLGKHGYAPAYMDEWGRVRLGKPKGPDSENTPRKFLPMTDAVIQDHLLGKQTIGVYPLCVDEMCWFLAADFDKKTWEDDAAAFLLACHENGVCGALERSRSGNGGHVWIFFQSPMPASLARKLGCALLTQAMQRRPHLGLDSYDRFFPSQDTMPKGGFGNLIALPLQRLSRARGNSVFIDASHQPYPDQWEFLGRIQRVSFDVVTTLVNKAETEGTILGVRSSALADDGSPDPWLLVPTPEKVRPVIEGPFPQSVRLVRSNMVFIEKTGLPPAMINAVIRLAAFQNPEFYKTQASAQWNFAAHSHPNY